MITKKKKTTSVAKPVAEGGNTTIAISVEARNAVNTFLDEYNKANPTLKPLTAKDYITLSLEYFQRTGVDIRSSVVGLAPSRTDILATEKINEMAKLASSYTIDEIKSTLQSFVDAQRMMLEKWGEMETRLLQEQERKEQKRLKAAEAKEAREADTTPTPTKKMGRILSILREQKKLSKKDVAQKTGLSLKVIEGLESGAGKPYLDTFLRYANVFGTLNVLAMFSQINEESDNQ